MNITRIKINNFLTVQSADINLENRGLVLIQGVNKDDSSADSNGAGKSSIADAICWAIYGVTARGVSTDAVVNKKAKKDCSVEIQLRDGADEYRIIRYRKDSGFKNQTLVQKRGPTLGSLAIDLHKGTERETQEVIDTLIGCSLEVFQAAVYAGQERMPDLPSMTDKHLKLMIEEAAGTEVLARAHQIARERLSSAQKVLNTIQTTLETLQAQRVSADAQLVSETAKNVAYEDERKPNAKKELQKALPLQKRIAELEAQIAAELAKDRDTELRSIAASFSAIKHEQTELKRLNDEVASKARALATAEAAVRMHKQAHTAAVEALRTVNDKVGQPCGECAKPYCEHDLEAIKKLRQADLERAESALRAVAVTYKTAKAQAQDAQNAATAHQSTMTDVSAMAARQRVLQEELAQIEHLKKEKTAIETEVEKLKLAAATWLKNPNPYTGSMTLAKTTLEELDHKLAAADAKKKEAEEEVALLQDVVSVYGPAGVRAHILDTVTPYLNERTSHYLSALADGNIHAVWSTLTTNAKGELKEKFQIEVVNDKGAESFAGLSGGEKRKVRLSCAMALQDLVASRATKPINIFIADEVDHALDESGLERLMTVLNDKAKERGTVLVISHNSLADWVDTTITITKEGGYGKVSGAVE